FVLPLQVMRKGQRVVYDDRATSSERTNETQDAEFRMRVRVALRSLQTLVFMRDLLNPLRHPRVAFSLWSHKVLRYTSPALLMVALLSSALLGRGEPFYAWIAAGQLAGYSVAGLALAGGARLASFRWGRLPAYFVLTNAAFGVALVRWLRGDRLATWKPR